MTTRTTPAPEALHSGLLLLTLGALVIAAVACGGSSNPSGSRPPDATPTAEDAISPIITNHTLAVGENRFSLMLLDRDNAPIIDADVDLGFFDLSGGEPVLKSQSNTRFIATQLSYVDEQTGEKKYLEGNIGVYVTSVDFDVPGRWSVDISVTSDSTQVQLVPFEFEVLEESPEPAIGDPAPASRQLTAADVTDIAEIDSSFEPRFHMHDITIADALTLGKPIVVAFAAPAFCTSRTCGPVMDTIMDPLYEKYRDDATFIHVEPLELKALREGTGRIHVEAAKEWGVETEPWIFVVDAQGKVAGKFEDIVARDEVEDVLTQLLEG